MYAPALEKLRLNGFALVPGIFNAAEVQLLAQTIDQATASGGEGVVLEKGSSVVRSIYGVHKQHNVFKRLCQLESLCGVAEQIVGEPVYVYQFKINIKYRLSGERWPWHRDFIFWREEDGLALPRIINVAVLVDDMTMLNGPLCFIPKSHLVDDCQTNSAFVQEDWQSHVSVDLKYRAADEEVLLLSAANGVEAVIAPAGSVVFFDSRILHASACNISPGSRRILFITYNGLSNAPDIGCLRRPAFLVERVPEQLCPLPAQQRLLEFDA